MNSDVIYQHVRRDKLIRFLLKRKYRKRKANDTDFEYFEAWHDESFRLFSVPVPVNQDSPNYAQEIKKTCDKLATLIPCDPLAIAYFLSCDKAFIGHLSELRICLDKSEKKRMAVTVKAVLPYDERDLQHQFLVPVYYWEWFVDFAQKATEKDLILIGGDLDFEGTMGWTRQQGEEYLHAPRRIRFDIPTIVKYVDNFSFGDK